MLYHDRDAGGADALYRIATAGGQPERLGAFPNATTRGSLHVSPDGKKIIAATLDSGRVDLWMLENFVPASAKP